MATVASARSDKGSPAGAVRRQLPEAAAQELTALRAALDQKLAALEVALASPAPPGSLETLVIDLARIATAEAEATAAKACLDAQVDAEREAAARAEAQRALRTERETTAALQHDLEQARKALKSERDGITALRRDLATAAERLERERDAALRLRERCEQAERKNEAERSASAALQRDVNEARTALKAAQQAGIELSESVEPAHAALERQREANVRLSEALAAVKEELAEVGKIAEQRAGDLDAARSLIEGLEHRRAELERARDEEQARAGEAARQRDAIATELSALGHDAERARSLAGAREHELEDARIEHERLLQDLRSRLDEAAGERESLAADLNAARDLVRAAQIQAEQRSQALADNRAESERLVAELQGRLDQALRDRAGLAEELETVRQAIQTERTEAGALAGAADDERARTARALKEAETRAGAIRDRDMMAEELELMRESLADVQNDLQARLDAVEKTAALRIAELEAELKERDRRQEDRRPRPLAASSGNPRPVRTEQPALAEPTLAPPSPVDAGEVPAAPHGSPVRRASRHVFADDLEVLIDGSPATLIDLSTSGAQVISHTAMKPNRMVRVQLPGEDNPITCKGKIVWARLEAGPTSGLQYRAGVLFTGVDERAIDAFVAQHGQKP
jgi:chromosome segregation ATPase